MRNPSRHPAATVIMKIKMATIQSLDVFGKNCSAGIEIRYYSCFDLHPGWVK
jgi:hypothetical protein